MKSRKTRFDFVSVKNVCGRFEVHWNYECVRENLTRLYQCERLDGYVDGFIDGLIVALGIQGRSIHRYSSLNCSISDLEANTALKMAEALKKLFQPLITPTNNVSTTRTTKQTPRNIDKDLRFFNHHAPLSSGNSAVLDTAARA